VTRTPTLTPTLAVCGTVPPGGTVLTASEDAYIDANHAQKDRNYGSANPLRIRIDPDADVHGLIRFNLSSIPSNARVLQATLFLYQETPRTGTSINFYRVSQPWGESTVTWLTAPAYTLPPFALMEMGPTANCLRSVYLPNSLVQGWINGSIPNYGMRLMGNGVYGEIRIASREDASPAQRPQLRIVYSTSP
jgi:hypothetical protein